MREHANPIDYLAELPLTELRRRQNLVVAQQRTAYETRNEHALLRLQAMENDLMAAVLRKTR